MLSCVGAFCFAAAVVAAQGTNLKASLTKADPVSYTWTIDKDHGLVADKSGEYANSVILTENGNDIWTKAAGVSWNDKLSFDKGGYIQNLSRLTGIKSVTITMISGSVELQHGYVEPSDLTTPMFFDKTFTATDTFSFAAFDNIPNYVRIIANQASDVSKIEVEYECANVTDPLVLDDYDYGLETTVWASKTNGIASIVEDGWNSDYCVKYENVHLNSNSECFCIDLKEALRKEMINLPDTVASLTFDVKDDNGVMAKEYNTRYGFPVEVSSVDGTQTTGWMNTIDWGGKAMSDGWYRLWYSFSPIAKANLDKLSIFLTRTNASDQKATEYLIDNVRLYESPISRASYYKGGITAPAYTYDATRVPTSISFEYQLEPGAHNCRFLLGYNWSNYFGWYSINDGVSSSTGLRTTKLKNNWYKFELMPTRANCTGTRNYNILLISCDSAYWLLSDFKVNYDTDVEVASGAYFTFEQNMSVSTYSGMTFELRLGDATRAGNETQLCLASGNNGQYIGPLNVTSAGLTTNYNGTSCEVLSDGYLRITLTFDNLNRASASWKTLAELDIQSVKNLYGHTGWGDGRTLYLRNVSFIPRAA